MEKCPEKCPVCSEPIYDASVDCHLCQAFASIEEVKQRKNKQHIIQLLGGDIAGDAC